MGCLDFQIKKKRRKNKVRKKMVSKVQATENGFYGDNPQNKENKNCLFVGCWGGEREASTRNGEKTKKTHFLRFVYKRYKKIKRKPINQLIGGGKKVK